MPQDFINSLTHKIIGSLYEAYNEIGFGYQEKHYYRGVGIKFKKNNLNYAAQLYSNLTVDGQVIGKYFIDFLVENKIVVEIKVVNAVYPQHIKQVLHYLRDHKLKVGIIGVFSKSGVIIKRVAN